SALAVLRRIDERLQGHKPGASLTVSAPYPVANQLLNEFRSNVLALEQRGACEIRILALASPSGDAVFASSPSEGDSVREIGTGRTPRSREKAEASEAQSMRKKPSDRRAASDRRSRAGTA